MDSINVQTEVLSSERSSDIAGVLVSYGRWHARELSLTGEKVHWIWDKMKGYPSLFSDLTRNNEQLFLNLLQNRFTYWLEIVDDDEETVGLLYITDLYRGIDASIHLLFFDRKPSEKAELVKEMIRIVFDKFPYLHRITATIPSFYMATIRLAKRVGFTEEGRKRQSQLIQHKWCDEVIFGLLAGEI